MAERCPTRKENTHGKAAVLDPVNEGSDGNRSAYGMQTVSGPIFVRVIVIIAVVVVVVVAVIGFAGIEVRVSPRSRVGCVRPAHPSSR
jgi:hypothetical protein